MKDINKFYSSNKYIFLPTNKDPKVILAVDNKQVIENSFKLYNPFSKKAKIFKNIMYYIVKFFPLGTFKNEGKFINFLKGRFNKNIISSIYIATANDKLVLQIQDKKEILGYIKFPLNTIGKKRLLNEKKAIDILYEKNMINYKYLIFDFFENTPFLFLPNIEGKISNENIDILPILKSLKKDKKYKLKNHPRIKDLLIKADEKYRNKILELISKSNDEYYEVYEHGDFAPWNIIKKDNKYILFDFEYFEERGLEYLDFIKYYYQVEKLLNKRQNEFLINSVLEKCKFKEKEIIFKIFLIKEIIEKRLCDENFEFEEKLLNNMEEK